GAHRAHLRVPERRAVDVARLPHRRQAQASRRDPVHPREEPPPLGGAVAAAPPGGGQGAGGAPPAGGRPRRPPPPPLPPPAGPAPRSSPWPVRWTRSAKPGGSVTPAVAATGSTRARSAVSPTRRRTAGPVCPTADRVT